MKKILFCLLVLCMIVSLSVFFTSCDSADTTTEAAATTTAPISTDAVNLAEAAKNPLPVLMQGSVNAFAGLFNEDYNLDTVVAEAMKNGTFGLSFSSEFEPLKALGKLELVGFVENGAPKAFQFSAKDGQTVYDATAFITSNGLVLDSKALLGNNGPIGIFLDTFKSQFADSALNTMMGGIPKEAIDEMIKTIEESFKNISDPDSLIPEDMMGTVNELMATLNTTAVEETIDGVRYAVITMTVDNATIRKFAEIANELMPDTMTATPAMSDASVAVGGAMDITAIIDELDKVMDIKCVITSHITMADCVSYKDVIDCTFVNKELNETAKIEGKVDYSADKFAVSIKVTQPDGTTNTIGGNIKKTVADGISTYALSVAMDGVTIENVVTYTYNTKTGDFSVAITADEETIAVNGKITVADKTASIAIVGLSAEGVTLDINLALTFTAGVKAPALPEAPKDLVTMTQADLEALLAGIQECDFMNYLAKVMAAFAPQEDPGVETAPQV